jgi:flagellar motor protein MotB
MLANTLPSNIRGLLVFPEGATRRRFEPLPERGSVVKSSNRDLCAFKKIKRATLFCVLTEKPPLNGVRGVTQRTWIIASAISAVLVIGILSFSTWDQARQLKSLREQLEQASQTANKNEQLTRDLRTELESKTGELEHLAQERDEATKSQKSLEQEMRGALESKDITISQLQGKLTVNILDRILFDSGEATLKPEGEKVLQKIADILTQRTNLQIQVVGHTDNIPIRPSARHRFPSNWELSTARATAAVRLLAERSNVDARRLSAAGCGEFRPLADNGTAEGRAKNRRIVITVIPDEMAPLDAPQSSPKSDAKSDTVAPSTNAVSEKIEAPALD